MASSCGGSLVIGFSTLGVNKPENQSPSRSGARKITPPVLRLREASPVPPPTEHCAPRTRETLSPGRQVCKRPQRAGRSPTSRLTATRRDARAPRPASQLQPPAGQDVRRASRRVRIPPPRLGHGRLPARSAPSPAGAGPRSPARRVP